MRNVRRLQESANTPQKIRKGSLRVGISYLQYDGSMRRLPQGTARNTLNYSELPTNLQKKYHFLQQLSLICKYLFVYLHYENN